MLVCKKIRMDLTEEDRSSLEFMQAKCRGLYNWWIGKLKDGEKWSLYSAKKTLKESRLFDPELDFVYGKLLQSVYFRLDRAMQAFFKRVKESACKAGFPRFKSRHNFFTLVYPGAYIQTSGKTIILPTGGKGKRKHLPNIVGHLREEPPANFKEVSVSKDSRGKLFCSFVYEREEEITDKEGILALDLGIKTLAIGVDNEGRFYHVGGFRGGRWYDKQLDKIRSRRDRCKKGSRRYRYLSETYKKVSEKRKNKQLDSLHKASHLIAHKLAGSAVVIGDLSQRQMVTRPNQKKNRFRNRLVFNNWGLYRFVQMLEYKTKLYGKELHKINEAYTSQTCCSCDHRQKMPLWKRTYKCPECGLKMDRDENSAVNIFKRFFARLEPHKEIPYGVLQAVSVCRN